MKVLISDKIDETALKLLTAAGIEFDYLPEIEPEKLLTVINSYEGLIVRSRTKVTQQIIAAGQKLKIIGRVGSGLDNIDVKVAELRQIKVVNAAEANSQAVAEHTLGLILALLRNYKKAFRSMTDGLWLKSELSGQEILGKTAGILGYGNIGQRVEKLLLAFGAKVRIYQRGEDLGKFVSDLDILTVHLPLNEETKNFISAKILQMMKPDAYLINASRGEIIDETALIQLIKTEKIKGAALDVFIKEPLVQESELRKLENVVLTPHIGASTRAALVRASLVVVEEFVKILK